MGQRDKDKRGKKRISEMLDASDWEIKYPLKIKLNSEKGHKKHEITIDALVNSASPDLMGGREGTVDFAIHKLIDEHLPGKETFNQKICKELSQSSDKIRIEDNEIIRRVRCPRGKAVLTSGYRVCKYVIHAVGVKYRDEDIPEKKRLKMFNTCCGSSVQIMESCYHEIIKLIRLYPDIKNIAIPIMGSGNHGYNMEFASRIAVSSVGNALAEWKQSDPESFETSDLEKIIFFTKSIEDCKTITNIIERYSEIYDRGHQVVFQDSFIAQKQYYNEILIYDENRGYFAIAGLFRRAILRFRMFFGFVSNRLKEVAGGIDWQRRRLTVEVLTVLKMSLPVIAFMLILYYRPGLENIGIHLTSGVFFYCMMDTVTYLIALLMMADIQKPSANVIRSLLLLLFNYLEVSFEITYFYYVYHLRGASLKEALDFGIFDRVGADATMVPGLDMVMSYGNAALKFFFITMVFGYLIQHMHLRKFKS